MYANPGVRTRPWAYRSSAISGRRMNTINIKTAWMYAIPGIRTGPWAYGSSAIRGPQTNMININTAWMYAIPAIRTRPWMYAPPDSLRATSACRAHGAPA